jgi:hypothetical protein
LLLIVLIGPFAGVALTTGSTRMLFIYAAGGIVGLLLLLFLISMLMTRRGREALSEGCAEGCLEAIFSGLIGG